MSVLPGPFLSALKQLPVNGFLPPQSQAQEAAEGIRGAPAPPESADLTGEDLALRWTVMLNLVRIAGLCFPRAARRQRVPTTASVPHCFL